MKFFFIFFSSSLKCIISWIFSQTDGTCKLLKSFSHKFKSIIYVFGDNHVLWIRWWRQKQDENSHVAWNALWFFDMISLTDENTTGALLSLKEGYIGNLNRDD